MTAPPEDIAYHIAAGSEYPYDADDDDGPVANTDQWHYVAARAVLHDLNGRHTIKWAFGTVDHEVRQEIVSTMAAIIKASAAALKQEKSA